MSLAAHRYGSSTLDLRLSATVGFTLLIDVIVRDWHGTVPFSLYGTTLPSFSFQPRHHRWFKRASKYYFFSFGWVLPCAMCMGKSRWPFFFPCPLSLLWTRGPFNLLVGCNRSLGLVVCPVPSPGTLERGTSGTRWGGWTGGWLDGWHGERE